MKWFIGLFKYAFICSPTKLDLERCRKILSSGKCDISELEKIDKFLKKEEKELKKIGGLYYKTWRSVVKSLKLP